MYSVKDPKPSSCASAAHAMRTATFSPREELYRAILDQVALDPDARNIFAAEYCGASKGSVQLSRLEHYETYVRNNGNPELADLIIALSDSNAIRDLNRLIDQYNQQVDLLNPAAALKLLARMEQIFQRSRN